MGETTDKIPGMLKGLIAVEKQRMRPCQTNYGTAAGDFRKAWESTSSKDFTAVLSWVQKGANEVTDCNT